MRHAGNISRVEKKKRKLTYKQEGWGALKDMALHDCPNHVVTLLVGCVRFSKGLPK